MKRLLPAALLLISCTPLKSYFVRDDWATQDAPNVKRLAVVVQPLPDGKEKAGEAWARVARRYVNQKRDFLVKKEVTQAGALDLASVCGGEDAIEGVLLINPTLIAKGDGFEIDVTGVLQRCSDGREAWKGSAAGSFPSKDKLLVEVTNVYVQELGDDVAPYVPPALNVLRPLLDTLPQPKLSEADLEEKLTLD